MKKLQFLILALMACLLVEAKPVNADFIVDQSGEGDFKTIQEAINAVPDFRKNETVIFIKNGTYKVV